MKSGMAIKLFIFVPLIVLGWGVRCYGEGEMEAAPMEKAEQEALYTAIKGFVGNWWNGSNLYPDPCGWTPIEGVSCDIYDDLWYITALSFGSLHDNSLGCVTNVEFREQLFELKHLKSLSFFNCFTSSQQHPTTIPISGWENLAGSLESLEFRSNPGLTGPIPTSLGHLMKLRSLVLLENGLSGELPTNLGRLSNLKKLVVSGNWLNGRIPDSFGYLSELLILDLSRNSLSGPLPLSLGGLTSLLKFDLSNNQLEGKIPKEIGYLKNITLLDLRNNKFSGELTKSLQEMYSLEEMVFSNNPIGGDLKSLEWKNLQNLVILDLSNTGLAGEVPEFMAELKRLRFLGLSNNKLTGSISPKLATMPCVSALYLNGNNLSGELQFSEWFYGKMGRRFGAWNNPNLCYPSGLTSTSHIPFGVKPCQQEVTLLQPVSKNLLGGENLNQNAHFMASLGFSSYSVNGFWWVLLVQLMMVLLLSFV
ncbi:hypothetical protein WN943_020077 [Citrus x changshan-huyou]|uniref:Disease resistance R13L4/SHOC-2-like LRR domain-containing protein n=1 Tax=Citrus unshiu TaxID=55188 RepID=A0A2H5QH39_CITUN|nr:piriformospora indica-insensitive protein 2-like [Citrus sinensis]GAY63948.1 hypothetical protein CUMW_229730 [Citrus unshiu]